MKVNKFIAGIMAVCVMGFGVPYADITAENTSVTASAEGTAEYTEGTYESLTYRNYGDYIEISGCDDSATEVIVPSEIDGVPVTIIGSQAFEHCHNLTSVVIQEGVTTIGAYAFIGCRDFSDDVYIPCYAESYKEEVTSKESEGGLKSVVLPDSLTSIGTGAFQGCSDLVSINIPDNVNFIGGSAFNYCSSLESIVIPYGVDYIEYDTFSGCESLKSVEIPDSVTGIGGLAFCGCSSLESIEIPDSVDYIGGSTFFCCSSLKSANIPDGVDYIGNDMFYKCESLTSVTISDSVTSIEKRAFNGCSSLESIEIPDSVDYIGAGAFSGCKSLTSVTIPKKVTNIKDTAFSYCPKLEEITILNPECDIADSDLTISNGRMTYEYEVWWESYYFNGTIYGYENSTAQKYAEKYGRNFVSIGKATVLGDMNGDDSVNIADFVFMQKYILGGQEITEEQYKNADMNDDGYVDSFDMVLLRRKLTDGN